LKEAIKGTKGNKRSKRSFNFSFSNYTELKEHRWDRGCLVNAWFETNPVAPRTSDP